MKIKGIIVFTILISTTVRLAAQHNVKIITKVVDAYPVVSPDGSKILFMSNRTGRFQIYSCDLDGNNLVQLTNSAGDNGTPSWSPDGKLIVFGSTRDDDAEIYIMQADGTNQRRLTNMPGDDSHPKFSPNGSEIIFNSARTSEDINAKWTDLHIEIYTMNTSGGNLKQITTFKNVSTYPGISPDGQKIVFRQIVKSQGLNWSLDSIKVNSEVFVMNIDGTNPINVSNSEAYDGWPCWMPDSKTILFSSNRGGEINKGQLYTVRIDGSGIKQITELGDSYIQSSVSKEGNLIYTQKNWETAEYEYGYVVSFEYK